MDIIIEPLNKHNCIAALSLVRRVFDAFVAPDYSAEGIQHFLDYTEPFSFQARIVFENIDCRIARVNERIAGVIATRGVNHISLFFVDKDWQGKGVGRALYNSVLQDAKAAGHSDITVKASPCAVPVYHKLGFGYTDVEREENGIRYTPMRAFLHGKMLDEVTDEERAALFPIILAPHNPAWKTRFLEEKARLEGFVSAKDILKIEHYGSTAVPDILAKPCIDILVEIKTETDLSAFCADFEKNGYIAIPYPADKPPHIMLLKGYTDNGFVGQTFHIHLRYPGAHEELAFRDCLIANPVRAKEYEALKLSLKEQYLYDRDGYTNAKTAFICATRT